MKQVNVCLLKFCRYLRQAYWFVSSIIGCTERKFLFKDSAKDRLVLSILIFMAIAMGEGLCAPRVANSNSRSRVGQERARVSHPKVEQKVWWMDLSPHIKLPYDRQVCKERRHDHIIRVSRNPTSVDTQLRYFIGIFTEYYSDLTVCGFYKDLPLPNVEDATILTVPLKKILKKMSAAQNKSRTVDMLLKFEFGLRKIAKTLDKAIYFKIKSQSVHEDESIRYCCLTDLMSHLKLLLTEVHEEIIYEVNNKTVNYRKKIKNRNVPRNKLQKEEKRVRDITRAHTFDISILKELEHFLVVSRTIISTIKMDNNTAKKHRRKNNKKGQKRRKEHKLRHRVKL